MSLNSTKSILIVDDESVVRESLGLILGRQYSVELAEHGEKALELLSGNIIPDLILLDLVMPGVDGIGLLEQISSEHPSIPVIMLTATKGVKTAVQAIKHGAVDYLTKPYDIDELLSLIEETLREGAQGRVAPSVVSTVPQARVEVESSAGDYGLLVGSSPQMEDLYQTIGQVAGHDATVLVRGESGTGKELIAKEIHQRGPRSDKPFVTINCAAIPESRIESELFGHETGALGYASEQYIGKFERAESGTLFLDEIAELSSSVQVKILRFLQEREFYRLGGSEAIKVDVRIIAATNADLEACIEEGSFRSDLFHRINVVSIQSPPLRERKEDVGPLFDFFLEKFAPLYPQRKIRLTSEAASVLVGYSWPGNVRELENLAESLLALGTNAEVRIEDLPDRIKNGGARNDLKEQVLAGNLDFESAEAAFEKDLITRALKQTNFVQTRAAKLLGISRRILKYKMDKLGIDPEVIRSSSSEKEDELH